MLLLCSFFGLKELFPVKNGLDEANASVNSSCAHTPPLPPGYCGAFAPLVSPAGGAFANFVLLGAGHLPTLGPLASFSHARSFLSEYNYSEGFIGSPVKDRNKLKRVVKVWSQFYACISSLHIKMELDSKNWSYRCESTCFGYWIEFLLILFEEHPFIFIKLFVT